LKRNVSTHSKLRNFGLKSYGVRQLDDWPVFTNPLSTSQFDILYLLYGKIMQSNYTSFYIIVTLTKTVLASCYCCRFGSYLLNYADI